MSGDLTARDVVADTLLRCWETAMRPGVTHSALTDADAVLAALAAAGYTIVTTDSAPAGICGDRAPTLPDQLIVCTLPAGHAGWHGNGRGTDWTGEVVPDAR